MIPQDQTQKQSNSSGRELRGGGRSAGKKPTSKSKIPKRGPGIAQLEKQRIDAEQRRKLVVPISPLSPSPSISYLPLQLPGFHHSNQPSSSSSVPLQDTSGMSMNFPYRTQRKQQYQQSSSSIVNVSSGNLTPPVDHYSKEPPSNHNNRSRVPMMVMPVDKMIILKSSGSHPLSRGVPPASSFNFKSPAFTTTNMKANESPSSRAYGTNYLNFGDASSVFRGVTSCSTTPSSSSVTNSRKNENLHGGFPSLGPLISPAESNSMSTFPSAFYNQELPPPSQETEEEDQIPHGQQQRLYNFFPPNEEKAQRVHTTETKEDGNCYGENGESIDLDMKL